MAKELVLVAKLLTANGESDYPYAVINVERKRVMFRISFSKDKLDVATGSEVYEMKPMKAIERVFNRVRAYGVREDMVELLT